MQTMMKIIMVVNFLITLLLLVGVSKIDDNKKSSLEESALEEINEEEPAYTETNLWAIPLVFGL